MNLLIPYLLHHFYLTDSSINSEKDIEEINKYYQDIRNNILKRNTEESKGNGISDTLELMSLNMKEI